MRHADLTWRAEAMLRVLGREEAELSVLLCDDATIRELNRDYRNQDRATDVLAFSMLEGEGGEVADAVLGDVVISIPTAIRQASRHDRPIIAEVTFLLAHGVLHLIGYDHQTDAEEREMNAMSDTLIRAVDDAKRTRRPVDKR